MASLQARFIETGRIVTIVHTPAGDGKARPRICPWVSTQGQGEPVASDSISHEAEALREQILTLRKENKTDEAKALTALMTSGRLPIDLSLEED